MAGPTDRILTPEQVENWRKVLVGMIGPYALLMPVAEIQQLRDVMQQMAEQDQPEGGK